MSASAHPCEKHHVYWGFPCLCARRHLTHGDETSSDPWLRPL